MDLENRIVDLLRLFADAVQGAASAGGIVQRTIIIVTPLEKNDVPGFDEGQRLRPLIFHDVGAAAAAADRAVIHVDLAGIEEIDQRLAPSPLAARPVGMAVTDGRVANEEECWKLRIGGRLEADLRVAAGSVVAPSIGRDLAGSCAADRG